MVGGDVARDRQPLGLAGTHQGKPRRAGQPAQVHARAGGAHQLQDGADRQRLGHHRDADQAERAGHGTLVGDAVARKMRVLRAQPDRVAEGRRVLQRAHQHLGVGKWRIGLAEGDAAGLGQLRHLGDASALQAGRQRTDRVDARTRQVACAELEHLHQTGLVERRIGIGWARQRGDAAGGRSVHLRLQRRLVFEARLAQTRRQIHQTRRDHQPGRLDDALRAEVGRLAADGDDLAGCHADIRSVVETARRVDDAPATDEDLHAAPPISRFITAMRTAIPNVTCGRMTACGPSATAESISTPRFMGPGCMTMASGAARASFSGVRP